MEKKMETTLKGFIRIIGYIWAFKGIYRFYNGFIGFYRGFIRFYKGFIGVI